MKLRTKPCCVKITLLFISLIFTLTINGLLSCAKKEEEPSKSQFPIKTGINFETIVSSEDALEILDKTIDALGGYQVLKRIQNITIHSILKSTHSLDGEKIFKSVVYYKAPNLLRQEYDGELVTKKVKAKVIRAYDGKNGWVMDWQGRIEDAPREREIALKKYIERHIPYNILTRAKSGDFKTLYLGAESIDDKEVKAIEVITPQGDRTKIYIDSKSYLPIKEEYETMSPAGLLKVQIFFHDYKEVKGIKIAFRTSELVIGNSFTESSENTISEIFFNSELNDSLFAKPSS